MKKQSQNQIEFTFEIKNYFKEKTENLLHPFRNISPLLGDVGDYLTEDIANDWLDEDVSFLEKLQQLNDNTLKITKLYKEINNNFSLASKGNPNYDPIIWTLEGLNTHAFWKNQRELADKLLNELNKL